MSTITTPTSDQLYTSPSEGKGLLCSGIWKETIIIPPEIDETGKWTKPTTVITEHPDEAISITLKQPGVQPQVLTTSTDESSQWSITFPSSLCRPGEATIAAMGISVRFRIAPNQRGLLTVNLNNTQYEDSPIDASNGARIKLSVNGAKVQILATVASPTHRMEFLSSLDANSSINPLNPPTGNVNGIGTWLAQLSIGANLAPSSQTLLVRDYDFFNEFRDTNYNFELVDFTPQFKIDEPVEDKEFYLQLGQRNIDVTVSGSIKNGIQSGYKAGTLTYTLDGQTTHREPDSTGRFRFVLRAVTLGQQRVILNATDQAIPPNPIEVACEFTIASKYKPKTIEELLSQRSYLADLVRFVGSHVLDNQSISNGKSVSSTMLSQSFLPKQSAGEDDFFGAISEPGSTLGDRVVNELLPAVSLLRSREPIVNFAFDKEQDLKTSDIGPYQLSASLSKSGLIGAAGTPKSGALVLADETDFAKVEDLPNQPLLSELGKNNADFAVSFWLYLDSRGSGAWRIVLYKGHEILNVPPTDISTANRTFAIFAYPDSNIIHYRIGTVNSPNEGGNSVQEIPVNQWTHIAYVKRGRELELFINGTKDSSVTLSGDVVANNDPMYMGRNPNIGGGFRGALDDVSIYGSALSGEAIRQLFLQNRSDTVAKQTPLSAYVRSAYEALLIAHGTSYEELRALPARGTAERLAIAVRLGLGLPEPNPREDVDILLIPTGSDQVLEEWLTSTFGLPSTREMISPISNPPSLLSKRQSYLTRRWLAEDTAPNVPRRPLIDPDLIDLDGLNSVHNPNFPNQPATVIWQQRRQSLLDRWTLLRNESGVNNALLRVYSQIQIDSLTDIDIADRAGDSITDGLLPLGLTLAGFRRLRFYQKLQQPLSEREKEDLSHLLTQVWKLSTQYRIWASDEQSLWPNEQNDGQSGRAFATGHYKRDFLPWRGNVADRIWFEKLVTSRLGAFDAIAIAHEQAVLDAQRTALPLFRDKLLAITDFSNAEDVIDALTERLLTDVGSNGTLTRTLIDHAVLTLQRLIDGIRLGRFESGHSAANWKLKTEWKGQNNTTSDDDTSLAKFDEEWGWMGTFGNWRTAKMTALYPENRIFPDLRTDKSSPYPMSYLFRELFLKKLRELAPSVPDDGWVETNTKTDTNNNSISGEEKSFFVPVAIGVMLERARKYSQALDWYRKVYDTRKPVGNRVTKGVLSGEMNIKPRIQYDDRWTLESDPHTNARRRDPDTSTGDPRFGNPYTRFILARIVTCQVGIADVEFAKGTDESRAKALDFYLESKQILGFEELVDLKPGDASEAYLPNPVFEALRDHVSAALRKLRRGLTYIGTPVLPDLTQNSNASSSLSRPTAYPFRILIERAKQLVALAQNLEAQYFSTLVKRDDEAEKFRGNQGSVEIAKESVSLRDLQQTEARDGVMLAEAQKNRSNVLRDQYDKWLAAGPNEHERNQIEHMWEATTAKDFLAGSRTALTVAQAAASNAGFEDVFTFGATKIAKTLVIGLAAAAEGGSQMAVNHLENATQLESIFASQQRREEEWRLQSNLAWQDIKIADQQIGLANDRVAISEKEYAISITQRKQAQEMLDFLRAKFTSVEFYEWMSAVLAEVYAFLLRTASTVALQAEGQLAFARQQSPAGLVKQDYWKYASQQGSKPSSGKDKDGKPANPDRRGITGSALLLQDIIALDQYAFDSERRLLNLSQTFSLARLFPLEFEQFRQTGVLSFATTIRMFDEGFPGHYMRLIKRVRLSVSALIPPNQGIRATLSTSGLSRVVTGDPSFPTLVVRQDPQSVALTSPTAATGVFELDMQSELLFPFEGMGVDTNWYFELPPAGNPFDYDTLFDVLISIDYTALSSIDLRDRVVKQLPSEMLGDRAFSIRRDFADTWYDLANSSGSSANIAIPLSRSDFPSQLQDVAICQIAVNIRRKDGKPCDFKVKPSVASSNIAVSEANAIKGIASSRQSGATTWGSLIKAASSVQQQREIWNFTLSKADEPLDSVLELLGKGEIDDIFSPFA